MYGPGPKPSRFVADYVANNITEPYVLEQMQKIFRESGVEEEAKAVPAKMEAAPKVEAPKKMAPQAPPMQMMADANEDRCPTCSSRLIITEGCSVCIECGFSGCGSG